MQDKFEERFKSLNARLAGMEGEQRKEEEDVLDVAKRRLQVRNTMKKEATSPKDLLQTSYQILPPS